MPGIHTTDGNTAAFHIPQPGQKIGDGGLSAAGGPHKSGHAIWAHREADVVQHLLVLVGKGHIMKPHFRLAGLCLSWNMLFPCVRELRLLQYSLNAVQGGVHHGQAGRLAIERLERPEQVKDKQEDAQHIGQRKNSAPLQKDRQAKNRGNPDSIKDIQPHGPRSHLPLKGKGCISGPLEIAGQFFRLLTQQVIALDDPDALYKGQHRVRQPFALLLTASGFPQGNFVHPSGNQPRQDGHKGRDQAQLPIQIEHKRQQNQGGQQIAHHVAQRAHGDFFDKHHVGAEDRTDFADIAGGEVAHGQFPQVSAQLHALLGKHQVARRALEAVAEVVDQHLHQHGRREAKTHIEAGLSGQCSGGKAAQHHKGQEDRHFRQDRLHKRAGKSALNTPFIWTGKFQNP